MEDDETMSRMTYHVMVDWRAAGLRKYGRYSRTGRDRTKGTCLLITSDRAEAERRAERARQLDRDVYKNVRVVEYNGDPRATPQSSEDT